MVGFNESISISVIMNATKNTHALITHHFSGSAAMNSTRAHHSNDSAAVTPPNAQSRTQGPAKHDDTVPYSLHAILAAGLVTACNLIGGSESMCKRRGATMLA